MTNQDASKHLGGREGKQQTMKTNTKQGASFTTWARCVCYSAMHMPAVMICMQHIDRSPRLEPDYAYAVVLHERLLCSEAPSIVWLSASLMCTLTVLLVDCMLLMQCLAALGQA